LFAREDGEVADPEGDIAEHFYDCVAHVGDENCEGGDGEEGPEDEEGLARVRLWVEIAIADSQERGVGEVEGTEIGPLLAVFGFLEDGGASKPEYEPGAAGDDEGGPAASGDCFFLDFSHEFEFLLTTLPFCNPVLVVL